MVQEEIVKETGELKNGDIDVLVKNLIFSLFKCFTLNYLSHKN